MFSDLRLWEDKNFVTHTFCLKTISIFSEKNKQAIQLFSKVIQLHVCTHLMPYVPLQIQMYFRINHIHISRSIHCSPQTVPTVNLICGSVTLHIPLKCLPFFSPFESAVAASLTCGVIHRNMAWVTRSPIDIT